MPCYAMLCHAMPCYAMADAAAVDGKVAVATIKYTATNSHCCGTRQKLPLVGESQGLAVWLWELAVHLPAPILQGCQGQPQTNQH